MTTVGSVMNAESSLARDSVTSLYCQVADLIERDILSGHYAPHSKLPSEHEIGERFRVSRVTVRQAMARLLDQGYVVKKQGKGTFVAGQKVHHDLHALKGFYDSLVSQGIEPETELVEFAAARRPALADCGLAGPDGECFYLRRLYRVNGAPIAMVVAYLPQETARVSWEEASETPIYGILESFLNIQIVRAHVRIRAQAAGARLGKALGLGTRAPLLVMERESYGADSQVREQSSFYIRPENYEFSLSTEGPLPISSAIRGSAGSNVKTSF